MPLKRDELCGHKLRGRDTYCKTNKVILAMQCQPQRKKKTREKKTQASTPDYLRNKTIPGRGHVTRCHIASLSPKYPGYDEYDARYDRRALLFFGGSSIWELNPLRAPEPLPILNPSNFVPKNGFPVVKGLRPLPKS